MRYIIESSTSYQEEVKEHYPCLEKYGLQEEHYTVKRRQFGLDEKNKRIELDPIKEERKYYTIEIGDMEELSRLIKDVENPVIVSLFTWLDDNETDHPCIEIYDGYRE